MKSRLLKTVAPATMCGAMMLGLFNVPIAAKSTTGATSSGSTSGNQTTNVSGSGCPSGSQLSGLDKQIFNSVAPALSGNQRIVCAASNGFNTEISGMNNIKNYHWTAWYKDKLNDAPDATKGTGNYHGFSADKVRDWQQYEDEIRELNGGKFPDVKEYRYPTDTKDGKLDFWGDIAGYYSVLGDPQYSYLTMKAYQHFSYTVETVNVIPSLEKDPTWTTPKQPEKDKGNKGNGGNNNSSSSPSRLPSVNTKPKDDTTYWKPSYACDNGYPSNWCLLQGFENSYTNEDYPYGWQYGSQNDAGGWHDKGGGNNGWCWGTTCYYKNNASVSYGPTNPNTGYRYVYYTVVNYTSGTTKALVAQAKVAADAYATEIAAYGRVSLTPGSKGTLTYDVPHNKFWKVTPSYWTDGGKQTIANRSDLPYHFESEGSTSASKDGKAPNNVNLYAVIKQKDKLYSFIHGYPEIDDHPGNTDETCVETDKVTCSEDETPIINIEIDIEDDEVQTQKEIDKFVHLRKDKK